MKITRKIIEIDEELCDGCGQCVPSCAEGALQIIDGKARMVAEKYCDGLGACMGECPTGALQVIEREADEFDEQAVEAYLEQKEKESADPNLSPGASCPSAGIQIFAPSTSANRMETSDTDTVSALSHWPVQIRLVPPNAPFLKGADLLVLADCGAVAYPALHQELLKNRVVVMGCPKFDDAEEYVQRFTAMFKHAGIRRITNVIMEVPCCSALPMMIKKALAASNQTIPMTEIVISTRGKVLSQR